MRINTQKLGSSNTHLLWKTVCIHLITYFCTLFRLLPAATPIFLSLCSKP